METETVNDRRAMSGKPRYRAESMRSQLRRHCCILAFFGCGIVAGCGGEEERVPPPLSTLRASWHTTLDSLRKLSESDSTNFVPLEKYAQAVVDYTTFEVGVFNGWWSGYWGSETFDPYTHEYVGSALRALSRAHRSDTGTSKISHLLALLYARGGRHTRLDRARYWYYRAFQEDSSNIEAAIGFVTLAANYRQLDGPMVSALDVDVLGIVRRRVIERKLSTEQLYRVGSVLRGRSDTSSIVPDDLSLICSIAPEEFKQDEYLLRAAGRLRWVWEDGIVNDFMRELRGRIPEFLIGQYGAAVYFTMLDFRETLAPKYMQEAYRRNPYSSVALNEFASLALHAGDTARAYDYYTTLRESDEDSWFDYRGNEALSSFGLARGDRKCYLYADQARSKTWYESPEKVMRDVDKALELDPNCPLGWESALYVARKDSLIQRKLELRLDRMAAPLSWNQIWFRVEQYNNRKEYAKAVAFIERQKASREWGIYGHQLDEMLSGLLGKMGKHERREQILRSILAQYPPVIDSVLVGITYPTESIVGELCNTLLAQGRTDAHVLRELLAMRIPGDWTGQFLTEALQTVGREAIDAGNIRGGLEFIQRAHLHRSTSRTHQQFGLIDYYMGFAMGELGKPDEARRWMIRADSLGFGPATVWLMKHKE